MCTCARVEFEGESFVDHKPQDISCDYNVMQLLMDTLDEDEDFTRTKTGSKILEDSFESLLRRIRRGMLVILCLFL